MNTWHAYVAGFFDGEGCIMISRVRMGQYSDNHRLAILLGQRIDHAGVLYELQAEFGGSVRQLRRSQKNPKWSDIAEWVLLKREDQQRFLLAVLPMLRVKRAQAELALQFIDTTTVRLSPRRTGGVSGNRFWAGTERLTTEQIETREGFREQMRVLNRQGHARAPATDAAG